MSTNHKLFDEKGQPKRDRGDDEVLLNVLRCHLTYWGQVVTIGAGKRACEPV